MLVVGASATGVQLAAELRRSGRPVTLSVGEHVRLPRMYRGRDFEVVTISADLVPDLPDATRSMLEKSGLSPAENWIFGDGFVEIEEVRKAGGVAVAVASDEVRREGVNAWKRDRLVSAGADVVVPEYRQGEALLRWLFNE